MTALVLALVVAQSVAGDMRIGLLPTTGDNVPPDLDRTIAAFLADREGAKPLDGDAMKKKIARAKSLGLSCAPLDGDCLLRLAILIELDMLVEPRFANDRLEVVVADALHRELKPRGVGPVGAEDRARDVRTILMCALDGKSALDVVGPDGTRPRISIDGATIAVLPATGLAPGLHDVVWDQGEGKVKRVVSLDAGAFERLTFEKTEEPPQQPPPAPPTDEQKTPVVEEPKVDAPSAVAIAAAAIGGAALVAGVAATVGAAYANSTFLDPAKPTDERINAKTTGQALVITSAALFLAAAAGAVTFFVVE